jgi:hypothetical protein
MKRFFRQNGLSIAWLALFVVFLAGETVSGHLVYNEDQREHHEPEVRYSGYLRTSHFLEATMENWESEFLQMFCFVVLTSLLVQRGSAESKKPGGKEAVDRDPRRSRRTRDVPDPVRRGGLWLAVYQHSLSLALFLLFAMSFLLHAVGGAAEYNQDQLDHNVSIHLSPLQYMTTSRFWFESFQNWQSEFLAVAAMVLLSIWLRQKGSPESKPVAAPHAQTGKD